MLLKIGFKICVHGLIIWLKKILFHTVFIKKKTHDKILLLNFVYFQLFENYLLF